MAKAIITTNCSSELKHALNAWAVKHNMSANQATRLAISQYIGYDLDGEQSDEIERRGRPRKYKDEAERKAVAAEKARESRKLGRELVAQFRRQTAKADMERFRESVIAKYGPIDDD